MGWEQWLLESCSNSPSFESDSKIEYIWGGACEPPASNIHNNAVCDDMCGCSVTHTQTETERYWGGGTDHLPPRPLGTCVVSCVKSAGRQLPFFCKERPTGAGPRLHLPVQEACSTHRGCRSAARPARSQWRPSSPG